MKKTLLTVLFGFSIYVFSQNFTVSSISDSLQQNADAVIRLDESHYIVESLNKMTIRKRQIVTVLNKSADHFGTHYEMYSPTVKINSLEIKIYNADGKEVKKVKKKDFTDESAISGFSLYEDNRILYYEHKTLEYPYTIEMNSEVESQNTLFIPDFFGAVNVKYAIEKDVMIVENRTQSNLRYKSYRNEDGSIQENVVKNGNSIQKITVWQENVQAIEKESYMPSLGKIAPKYSFALDEFMVEGEKGTCATWEEFGKWLYALNKNTVTLSDAAKKEVHAIADALPTKTEKVHALYQYLQNKTRYISVQLGIGGLKPMLADDVYKLSYGDCKALSNYMNAILTEVGITSNYAVITAGNEKVSFDPDFTKFGGNHAILHVPDSENPIWLECTSQQTAFNYLGDFTGERNALLISENGGTLVQTQNFPSEKNTEEMQLNVQLSVDATSTIDVTNTFSGIQYDVHLSYPMQTQQKQKELLQKSYDGFTTATFSEPIFNNDRRNAVFQEKFTISNAQLGKKAGQNFIVPVVPTHRFESTLKPNADRIYDIFVNYGMKDSYTITFEIPNQLKLEKVPENVTITDKEFGSYSLQFIQNNNQIIVKRIFQMNGGTFSKKRYDEFVLFFNKISKADATKMLFQISQ